MDKLNLPLPLEAEMESAVEQGCNSIDISLGPESGPEPGPSHVWSFETYLNFQCPSTELGPELGPVSCLVLCPKFIKSIELTPRCGATRSPTTPTPTSRTPAHGSAEEGAAGKKALLRMYTEECPASDYVCSNLLVW